MTTRIRYRKTSDPNVLQSVQSFRHETNGSVFKVMVNPELLEYTIVNTMGDVVAANGRAVNLHQVKIKAKNTLKELGISFDMEQRETL